MWRDDPLRFSAEVLGGEQPWRKQADVLRAVRDHRFVAVRSGHGVGKTWTAARAALWFLFSFPRSIVVTTAPTHRQVKSILWGEIRRQYRGARVPLGGSLTETALRIDDDWFALGLSTDEPERFQGYHSRHLLLIFDEAPGIAPEIYEAARTLLTGEHSRFLLIGNPTSPQGDFYDAFRSDQWQKMAISCLDSPNLQAGRSVYPKLVTAAWVEERRYEWGGSSPLFKARVLGEFPDEGENTLLPLSWLETAQRRAEHLDPSVPADLRLGVDVARHGEDETVFLIRDDWAVRHVAARRDLSTMQVAGEARHLAKQHGIRAPSIFIDDCGVGGGVTDRLREQELPVTAVIAGAAASNPRRFLNKRAEAYWRLRRAVDPCDKTLPRLAIPREFSRLIAQLAGHTYDFTSAGQIKIEGKAGIRGRLGQSPDRADALALTYAAIPGPDPRVWVL